MAKYRQLHTDFWNDGFVLDLTPEEKYFYLYLMTNPNTTQCGVYEIPKRIIETQTGYNRETVDKLLSRFEDYKKIEYCNETKEIMILNWVKYNEPKSPNAIKCVNKELNEIKHVKYLEALYRQFKKLDLDTKNLFYGIKYESLEHYKHLNNNVTRPMGNPYEKDYKCNSDNYILSSNKEVLDEVINISEDNIDIVEEKDSNAYIQHNFKDIIIVFENNIHPLTPIEYEKFTDWSESFSCDVIILAIEEAVNYNIRNMRYIEGILFTWRSKGITTPEGVKSYQREWQNKKTRGGDGFHYDGERKYDYDKLEKKLLGWDKEIEENGREDK